MTPEQAALDIFLVYECSGHDHFTAQLIRLIAKSDSSNRRKIAHSFPTVVSMWEEWYESPTPEEFYKHYNVHTKYNPDDTEKPFKDLETPIPEDLRDVMNDIAELLDRAIADYADRPTGFLLMTFDFGENGRMNYISNGRRRDIISMLEEFLEKQRRA